jgi:hypothetical protein
VLAVCPTCERKQLHDLLLRKGMVQDNPIDQAFDALVRSYRLDENDEADRAWDQRP